VEQGRGKVGARGGSGGWGIIADGKGVSFLGGNLGSGGVLVLGDNIAAPVQKL